MEYLFSLQQQQKMYEQGELLYMQGKLKEAEQIFHLTLESANQHADYKTYTASLIKITTILINTQRYYELFDYMERLKIMIGQYGSEEDNYLLRIQIAIFNYVHGISDPTKEFLDVYNDLKHSQYEHLLIKVVNNLLDTYYEYDQIDNGLELFKDAFPLYQKSLHDESFGASPFIFAVNAFRLFYARKKYEQCAILLTEIEDHQLLDRASNFTLLYWCIKALVELQIGELSQAKKYFEKFRSLLTSPYYFLLDIELWIATLKEKGYEQEIIPYLEMALQAVKSYVKFEENEKRSQLIKDISQKHYEEIIFTDHLTQIQNRNYYEDLLEKEQHYKNSTIAVLDIDRFKLVNDNFGHIVGDQAIKFLAKHIKSWAPRHDISLIRYGGDEFIIIMPYPIEEMRPFIEELHQHIAKTPFILYETGEKIELTLSIGVGYTNETYVDVYTLFSIADKALYEAKKLRNTVIEKEYH